MLYRFFILLTFCYGTAFSQTTVNTEQNVITGVTDVRMLERSIGYKWFKDGYFNYQVNQSAVSVIKEMPKDIQFVVFAGTWCEISRQILPQFYRSMDLARISKQRITLCFLDRDKKSPQGLENSYNINTTPVIIILQKGIEIGRITENTFQPIEAAVADLIPKKQ